MGAIQLILSGGHSSAAKGGEWGFAGGFAALKPLLFPTAGGVGLHKEREEQKEETKEIVVKILALMSSYRKRGNTARIVEMIEVEMEALAARREEPLEFEMLYLGHVEIEFCRGCRTCFDRGEEQCPLKDDVPAIRAKIDAADGIILASPVYVDDVNGILKNWIDRMAYICHRPAFADKCVYLVATVADSPTSHALRTMMMAFRTWGAHIVGQAGYKMGALMDSDEAERRFSGDTAEVAEALFKAVSKREYLRPSFLALMIFKIQQLSWQQAADPDSVDYSYWKGQGWFDPDCTFYIEHQANPVKVGLARLTGTVLARFVT
jgi:multimeric flavodoxin WrbA